VKTSFQNWKSSLSKIIPILMLCSIFAHGQGASVTLAPTPQQMFFDQNGKVLAFGCVFTYASGTTTPLATFTDFTGTVQNANPITLNASGSANIWLQSGQPYTIAVKSNGGTDCSLGTLMYSIDGIGAGGSQTTTVVTATSGSVSFVDQAQNQLFQITLTGDMVGLPISAVGVTPPGFITFEITQDGVGSHAFTWPSNSVGGCTISGTASNTTLQTFVWDGVNAIAVGPCTVGNGPTMSLGNLYDIGLSASSVVCTDANKQLVTSCASINTITFNGQAVANGGSGNVNVGAAAHSLALNQGNGNPLTGLLLTAHQTVIGTATDPVGKTIPDCQDTTGNHLNYTQSTDTWSCGVSSQTILQESTTTQSGDVSVTSGVDTVLITKAVTMPSTGCPCRVLMSYGLYFSTSNATLLATRVRDGTNQYATSVANTTGSATLFGSSATAMTDATYANGATVTFTANVVASQNITALKSNSIAGQFAWLNLVTYTTN
jgi:hypothetical protein